MTFLKKNILLLLSILPFALSQEHFDSVIVQIPEIRGTHLREWAQEEAQLECLSWRVAVEANNLSPWKTVPENCGDYVKEYMSGRGYVVDLERVSNEAGLYARTLDLNVDGKDCWIFDVDETLISNLPYYVEHGYGLEIFNATEFDQWVETGTARPIESSLKLYEEVVRWGFKAILLTGRSERHKAVTVENLIRAGFREWHKLILRSSDDHGKTATVYKSEKRSELVAKGYRILGNSGDQWSDLLGSSTSTRSFKLPNPMYYIP